LKNSAGSRFDPQAATALVAAVRENPDAMQGHMRSDAELARFEMLFRDHRGLDSLAAWCATSF
jgi:hypothetical protein